MVNFPLEAYIQLTLSVPRLDDRRDLQNRGSTLIMRASSSSMQTNKEETQVKVNPELQGWRIPKKGVNDQQ